MADRKTLIVGASGMIGKSLSNALESKGRKVLRSSRSSGYQLDLNDFEKSIFEGIDQVIFCATPNYKLPVEHLEQFFRGAHSFLSACNEQKIPVVFLSTNLVFDGTKFSSPMDPTSPICLYGQHKADLEKVVSQRAENTIVRFAKVIGPKTQPFFDWVGSLVQKRPISAFANLLIAPLSLSYVTEALSQIILQKKTGIFHLAAHDQISFADTMALIAEKLNLDANLIQRVQADARAFPRVERQSGLDCRSSCEATGLLMPLASQAISEFCGGLVSAENARTVPYV